LKVNTKSLQQRERACYVFALLQFFIIVASKSWAHSQSRTRRRRRHRFGTWQRLNTSLRLYFFEGKWLDLR
jgi:hypothetical protein